MLPSGAIAWHSKTQSITALTSTEAQFLLLSLLLNPFFTRHVLNCFGHYPIGGPIIIYEDNEACIKVINAWHSAWILSILCLKTIKLCGP
jgi:hypothetical protein